MATWMNIVAISIRKSKPMAKGVSKPSRVDLDMPGLFVA
jgi:hypothetical protein